MLEGEIKIGASEGAHTIMLMTTKPVSSLLLTFLALALYGLITPVLLDDVQPSDELSNLFFDDGSTFTLGPEADGESYRSTTDFINSDFFLTDASDNACETGSSQLFDRRGKRAHEKCKTQSPILRSPINLPQLPQLETDPLNPQEPKKFLEPDPNDLSLPYPFELPPDNYKICPRPSDGRLYAVCDSGMSTDNKYERFNTYELRYCTLYNIILGCDKPHNLWCCQYYYLDTLAVELGIIEEGIGVGRYCVRASFLKTFGLPLFPP